MKIKRTIPAVALAAAVLLTVPGSASANTFRDTNGDGRVDYVEVDQNNDGVNDWGAGDRDHDGRNDTVFTNTYLFDARSELQRRFEYVAFDMDENGLPEYGYWDRVGDARRESLVQFSGRTARYVWRDADGDGRYELGEYDGDNDWVFEWTMIDTNRDGVADAWRKTSTLVPSVGPMSGVGVVDANVVNTAILNGIFQL